MTIIEKEILKYKAMKAPRGGVVIRVNNDPTGPRAFKLKTNAHYGLEAAAHDAGEVDMEESESEETTYSVETDSSGKPFVKVLGSH